MSTLNRTSLSRSFSGKSLHKLSTKRTMQTPISFPQSQGNLYFSFNLIPSSSASMHGQAIITHAISIPQTTLTHDWRLFSIQARPLPHLHQNSDTFHVDTFVP